jgi:hypothetical protein
MALFSKVDLGSILEEVLQRMERELLRKGIRVTMEHRSPLPLIRLESGQFRNALQRALEFFSTLLPQGGQLEIQAELKKLGDEHYVEVGIASPSTSLDVFGPALQVEGHQAGLDIEPARRILSRYRDRVIFRKENPQRMAFTILLKVH